MVQRPEQCSTGQPHENKKREGTVIVPSYRNAFTRQQSLVRSVLICPVRISFFHVLQNGPSAWSGKGCVRPLWGGWPDGQTEMVCVFF